jgi:hypothetical protein
MKNYYTTQQMIDFIDDIDPLTVEFEGHENILEEITVRLKTNVQHIQFMQERCALAEKVIGELYLMQREYEE